MIFSLFVVAVCVVVAIAVAVVVVRRVRGDSVVDVVSFTPSSPPEPPVQVTSPQSQSAAPSSSPRPTPLRPAPLRPAQPMMLHSEEEVEIRALIDAGNMIAAIKRLREFVEIGLADAKRFVEDMQQGRATILRPEIMPEAELVDDVSADSEVQLALARGNKIEAIKRVRELTGMGLKESKDYVEALVSGRATQIVSQPQPAAHVGDLSDVQTLAAAGRKIEAIKRYREITGVGLKEAKDYVDALM